MNRIHRKTKVFTLIAVSLSVLLTSTSAPSAPQDNSAPIYAIEALVFKHLKSDSSDKEYLEPELEKVNFYPEVAGSVRIGRTPSASSALSKAVEKMNDSGDYRIIAHQRWVQNADAKSDARRARINVRTEESGSLDGTITFYMSRFLHLDINLLLQENVSSFMSDETKTRNYRIAEARRIKTSDVNYFDHPEFGVLVQIKAVSRRRK